MSLGQAKNRLVGDFIEIAVEAGKVTMFRATSPASLCENICQEVCKKSISLTNILFFLQ